jgi:CxxC motif-containing protein (DUF1111 family)
LNEAVDTIVAVPPVGRPSLVLSMGLAALVTLSGCARDGYSETGPASPGGEGTAAVYGAGAFGQPASNLDDGGRSRFRIGDEFFTEPWTPVGEGSPERDGLGPTYLATSCASCHPADGRSSAPGTTGDDGSAIVRFVGPDGGGIDDPAYHVQLQTRAISGVPPEASMSVTWSFDEGSYPDGTRFQLRVPSVVVSGVRFGPIRPAPGVRVGPALIGLGLLEAIPADGILANADPADTDGDGISGRPALVDSPTQGHGALGRFGHKANAATIEDQTALAYLLDIGITSPLHPEDNCPSPQASCAAASPGGTPEISGERFDDVVFYARTLAVPGRPSAGDPEVVEGEAIFDDLGCAACHVRRWVTGDHEIPALAGQTIYPYTDLLLHDLGPALSDGRSDGVATASEWRTPALWGLGLVRTVNPSAGFLHDGRARSIEEAVLWHGGEAQASRDRFVALPADARTRVLEFLASL